MPRSHEHDEVRLDRVWCNFALICQALVVCLGAFALGLYTCVEHPEVVGAALAYLFN